MPPLPPPLYFFFSISTFITAILCSIFTILSLLLVILVIVAIYRSRHLGSLTSEEDPTILFLHRRLSPSPLPSVFTYEKLESSTNRFDPNRKIGDAGFKSVCLAYLYNVLKVNRKATDDDLKSSYKRLAMKWHHDKNPVNKKEGETKLKQISETYDVLSDPQKRDLYGEEGLKSFEFGGPGDEENTTNTNASFRFNSRDKDDIFNEFSGGSGCSGVGGGTGKTGFYRNGETGNQGNRKAAASESKLLCSLEELYKGATKKMKVSRSVPDDFGKPKIVEEILKIDIKPGWKKGTKITFPEKGIQEPGVIPADLIFVVDEKPHAVFKRDRNDLIVNQKISLLEAFTGKTVDLTNLDGRYLAIPVTDIIKPGHEIVISNEGMPISKEPHKKGNLRIKFDVTFPSRLTSEQKSDLKRVLGGIDI